MASVWPMWVYSTATATSTATNTIWDQWQYTTAGTADSVWDGWVLTDTGTSSATGTIVWTTWTDKVEETKAQKRARLKREAEVAAQWEQQRVEREARAAELRVEQEAAVVKAEVLLREHLAAPQRAEYDRLKEFLVKAQSGRTYKIKKGWSGNVELLDDEGKAIIRFCIHPSEQCPDQDNMLAQKFLLETDEEAFNKIANKTQLRQPIPV